MHGFEPIIGDEPTTLILGSMPSVVSLEQHQYYAHPRNSFWWIMSQAFNFDVNCQYQSRCEELIENKVAVWDVLHECDRRGSLDSAIVKDSEVSNDFASLILNYTSIEKIIFNGAAAENIFMRLNVELMHNTQIKFWHRCPSTSPAHASMTKHEKLKKWLLALT